MVFYRGCLDTKRVVVCRRSGADRFAFLAKTMVAGELTSENPAQGVRAKGPLEA